MQRSGCVLKECSLCNTLPKTRCSTCWKPHSSLRAETPALSCSQRQRGASPWSPCSVSRPYAAGANCGRGRVERGSRGPSRGAGASCENGTLPRLKLEVQHEDGEKPSPRLGGGSCRSGWGSGCRSSRKGQAGRIREGLQPVWSGLLVRAGDGHVLEDRLLRPRPNQLECGRRRHSARRE